MKKINLEDLKKINFTVDTKQNPILEVKGKSKVTVKAKDSKDKFYDLEEYHLDPEVQKINEEIDAAIVMNQCEIEDNEY